MKVRQIGSNFEKPSKLGWPNFGHKLANHVKASKTI